MYCTLEQKSSCCVFIYVWKQPNALYSSQAEMAADSSLTSSVVLLMCLSGIVYYIKDHNEFTKSQKSMLLKTDLDRLCICSSVIGVSG